MKTKQTFFSVFLISLTVLFPAVFSCATTSAVSDTQIKPEASPADVYADILQNDVSITVVSGPGAVTVNRKFAAPFVFAVRHSDGSPYADFDIELTYPAQKNQGIVEYKSEIFKTDSDGFVTFAPETPAFAAADKVTVRPAVLYNKKAVKEACDALAVSAPFLVRSDIAAKGAVLFIWDFNEKGSPTTNFTQIQSELRSRGIMLVGNGPVNEISYIGKDKELYRDTYAAIGGNAYGYLISGTVRYERPVESDADGYVCAMTADIRGIRMRDGEVVFSGTFTQESRGKNRNISIQNCKESIAGQIVDALIFGL